MSRITSLVATLGTLTLFACVAGPEDPSLAALAVGDYWFTGEDTTKPGAFYIGPRPDGSRSMKALCEAATPTCTGSGCIAREVLDRYGWCDGSAKDTAQVNRLNAMSRADAEAIASALNARLQFVAFTSKGGPAGLFPEGSGSVDPYLDGAVLKAVCDENPTEATSTFKRVCEFEESQCRRGECTAMALVWTADEATVGATLANRLFLSRRR